MANNGVAVALPLDPVADTSPGEEAGIERAIGEVLIALASASVRAWQEAQADGHISEATRSQGGNLIAELVLAQAEIGQNEFADMMRRVGRLRYHDAGLSAVTADATITGILQMVNRVNAMMRACAH
jgi:hypothetical protein